MVGHLFHLFTKWPRHMYMEGLFSPHHNVVGSGAVIWNGNGEMTYEYSIFLWNAANALNMYNDCASSSVQSNCPWFDNLIACNGINYRWP